ncbi:beta subunit of casein kinase II, partial [Piptocephalis cylindrospora]
TVSWVTWFCSLPENEYLVEVSEEFLEDDFNLNNLSDHLPQYHDALEMILDLYPDGPSATVDEITTVEAQAESLYHMIHARYLQSRAGLEHFRPLYLSGKYGTCPRVLCRGISLLPAGYMDPTSKVELVKLYCPHCGDLYQPPQRFRRLDVGTAFGSSFPHIFLQAYPGLREAAIPKTCMPLRAREGEEGYVGRIYGFRISPKSPTASQRSWMR